MSVSDAQAEFDKLPATEKLMYTPIPPRVHVADPSRPNGGSGGGGGGGGGFGGGFHGGGFGGFGHGASWGGGRGFGRGGGFCGGRGVAPFGGGACPWARPGMGMGCGPNGANGANGANGSNSNSNNKLAARFVRDVSIFDGTQMAPSTKFTKIWRLKNSGELPWPAGTRMLFVGGDQMTVEMSVPLSRGSPVMPGEEVDVDVEMQAPAEHGRYLSYFRLMGPRGRKFGQRVWCHVQVVDPAAAPEEDVTDGLAMDATAKEILLKKQSLAAAEPDADDAGMADEDDVDVSADGAVATHKESVVEAAAAPKEAATDDGNMSDVSESVLVDVVDGEAAAQPSSSPSSSSPSRPASKPASSKPPEAEAAASSSPAEGGVAAALAAMGFTDEAMVQIAINKHGDDLDACAADLAQASEWDSLLDDLAEMGFANRELNKTLMLRHDGNLKRTVKALVEDA